jgi:hypothetical protein
MSLFGQKKMGRSRGQRVGRSGNQNRNSLGGRGRMGGDAAGLGGICVCTNPDCQHEMQHQRGVPCYQLRCSKCSSPMTRK